MGVLRVEQKGKHVFVERFELEMECIEGFSELPLTILPSDAPVWFQRKLAILMTFPYEPPTNHVSKLGKRIDKNVFWVEYEGVQDGNDTREKS
jgi:hypothetical protein